MVLASITYTVFLPKSPRKISPVIKLGIFIGFRPVESEEFPDKILFKLFTIFILIGVVALYAELPNEPLIVVPYTFALPDAVVP